MKEIVTSKKNYFISEFSKYFCVHMLSYVDYISWKKVVVKIEPYSSPSLLLEVIHSLEYACSITEKRGGGCVCVCYLSRTLPD